MNPCPFCWLIPTDDDEGHWQMLQHQGMSLWSCRSEQGGKDDLSYSLVWKTAEQTAGRTVLSFHGKDFILINFSFGASPCGVSEFYGPSF